MGALKVRSADLPAKVRKAPVRWASLPAGSFLLGHGVDYWQQSYNWEFEEQFYQRLEKAQRDAQALDPQSKTPIEIEIGDEKFDVMPHGMKGGNLYLARAEGMWLFIFRRISCDWNVQVRCLAAGLWQYGFEYMRDRPAVILSRVGSPRGADHARVSRVDYAFDFYSPDFSPEMSPAIASRFMVPRRVKFTMHGAVDLGPEDAVGFGQANRLETYMIGLMPGAQVILYDKSREIRQVDGTEWLLAYYQQKHNGFDPGMPPSHMWRLEARAGKEYLKRNGWRTPSQVTRALPHIVRKLITDRRLLMAEGTDSNRSRHEGHWLHGHALTVDITKPETPLVVPTQSRAKLREILRTQMTGLMRTASVLGAGKFDARTMHDEIGASAERVFDDPLAEKKNERAVQRYKNLDKPR
jgi:hypothetical protein